MDMKQLDYRGWRSTTLQLVLMVLVIGTALVWFGKISSDNWTTGVLGLVAAYVLRDVASKGIEAAQAIKSPPG